MKNLWRQVLRNKIHSFINLFGLTLGLTACTFILLYVQDELSYDKYLPGHEQVFRIQPHISAPDGEQEWATSEGFVAPALASTYPEMESFVRMLRSDNELSFTVDSTDFLQDGVVAADSTLFKVFPLDFIYGDRSTALDKPDGIVISEEVSRKFFGNIDPVGKLIITGSSPMQVTGVFRDIPWNSHLHFKVAFQLKLWFPDADQSHTMYAFYSYARLRPGVSVEAFGAEKLATWYEKHGIADQNDAANVSITLGAKPIADIHLKSRAEKEYEANGQMQIVWVFIGAAILILIIATINYINLSNAIAIKRAKEVAIRKTIGASRQKLFLGFMIESYLFTLIPFFLSAGIVLLLLDKFNTFTGKHIDLLKLTDGKFLLVVLGAWLVIAFFSGFYAATVLSSFNPVKALKSGVHSGRGNKFSLRLQRGLIIFQFAVSSFMIICAFTIQQQLRHIAALDVGFNKNNVMVVSLPYMIRNRMDAIKTEIEKVPSVESTAVSSVVPGKRVVILTVRVPDLAGQNTGTNNSDDGTRDMRVLAADHDFVKTLGLRIIEGRDLSIDNPADRESAFILNETAVREFNLKDPIGKPFEYLFGRNEPKKGFIIGVVKDFNYASAHAAVEPLMIHYEPNFFSTLSIRLKSGQHLAAAIPEVETAWKEATGLPFRYNFLDTTYDNLYRSEQTTGQVMTCLTVLALIIACLGLFGVVSFFVVQRKREVGIRKVFGATQLSLFKVLSNEYVLMVIAGNVVAFYPSWYLSRGWLQQFAYRVEISWVIFATAFFASSLLAIGSIFYVILQTSKANPATILRNE